MDEKQNVESGITLVELVQMLFRNIVVIALITIVVTIIGVIYTFKFIEPTYQAKTDIMVQVNKGESGNPSEVDLTSTLRIVQTVAEFIKKDIVLDEVIADLGLDTNANSVRRKLKVDFSSTSLLINISYEHHNSQEAARILNEIIDVMIEKTNSGDYPVLKNTVSRVGAAKEGTYSSPNKSLNTIISFLLGGIIGVVTALLLEVFKTTIRNKKDLETFLPNYQVIGVIPVINEEQ